MYDTGRSIWTTSRLVIAFIGITCVSVLFPLVLFLPLPLMRECFLFCVNFSSFTISSPRQVSIPKIFSSLISLILSYFVLKRLVFVSRFLGLISIIHKLISRRCSMCSRSFDGFVLEKLESASYYSNIMRPPPQPWEIHLIHWNLVIVQSQQHFWLFLILWVQYTRPVSLTITQGLPEIMSIEWVKLYSHLLLSHPCLLLICSFAKNEGLF